MHVDEAAEDDDDDDDTVGQDRERSTSSESGFDMLLQAAHQEAPKPAANKGKGKRKAGSETVANWRESGIPSGVGQKGSRRSSMKDAKPPPQKRRRSEISDSQIDPSLDDEDAIPPSSPMTIDPAFEDSDDEFNSGDSAYEASAQKRRRSKGKGKKPATTRGRTSGASSSKAGPSKAGPSKSGSSKAGPSTSKAAPKRGKQKAVATNSPGPSTAAAAGGVQCEYVNPLPVSLSCLSL
jgi:hypothetical protein